MTTRSLPPPDLTEIIRVGDNKKVYHIDLVPQEQLLAVISGRNRHVRLFPMAALDGREMDSYKLAETKGCTALVSGSIRNNSFTCLCVAMKRQVICYEVGGGDGRNGVVKHIVIFYKLCSITLLRKATKYIFMGL